MPNFTDTKDRTWSLEVHCDAIEEIKTQCGVNILDLLDPDSDLAKEATLFPPLMCRLLFAAVADQAKTKEVDEREFRRSMNGDCLSKASELLLEQTINFFPQHRRKVAAAVLAANRDVQEAATELALERLADPALKIQYMAALEGNLRREMESALERIGPPIAGRRPPASETASSIDAGRLPGCSDSPDQALTPGGNSAG